VVRLTRGARNVTPRWLSAAGQPEHDAVRDAEILERFGVTVIRLDEDDLSGRSMRTKVEE